MGTTPPPPARRAERNRRIADYLIARHSDPLQYLHRMAAMPIHEIATMLRCSAEEAQAEKQRCAAAATPPLDWATILTQLGRPSGKPPSPDHPEDPSLAENPPKPLLLC